MTLASIKAWMARNKLLIAFAFVILAGYTVGKDMALRDNAREAKTQETSGRHQSAAV